MANTKGSLMKEPTKDDLRDQIVQLKATLNIRDKQMKMLWQSRNRYQQIIHDLTKADTIDTGIIDAITVESDSRY